MLIIILHLGFAAAILLRSGDIHPHPGPRKTCNIISWNCNSLRGKLHELELINDKLAPDIIGLCETKLNKI